MRTFSIGFPVPEYDETRYARAAAERFGTEHEEFQVEPDGVEILPQLVWHYDEPFADSSAVPTWYVSQLTRRHVTVALTGDGGDELFAGYPRYRPCGWPRGSTGCRPCAAGLSGRHLAAAAVGRGRSRVRRLKRFGEVLRTPPRGATWSGSPSSTRPAGRRCTATSSWPRCPTPIPLEFLHAALRRPQRRDPVTAFSLADLVTYLPCDLMTKVDIASMAHGLECRQPFLDYRVVELAAAMPAALEVPPRPRQADPARGVRRPAAACNLDGGPRWASACRWTTGSAHELRDVDPRRAARAGSPSAGLFSARGGSATGRRTPAGPVRPRLPALVAAGPGAVAAGSGRGVAAASFVISGNATVSGRMQRFRLTRRRSLASDVSISSYSRMQPRHRRP